MALSEKNDPAGDMLQKNTGGLSPVPPWIHHLESETHTEPADAIILRFVGQHAAGINEYAHISGEAIFHADAGLGEPRFERVEVAPAAAKHVRGQSTLTQRNTQNQITRSVIDKDSGGVFRISIGANTNIPGDEII